MASTLFLASSVAASQGGAQGPPGRWDLTATEGAVSYPMWLELLAGPPAGGRLQGRTGHALPLAQVSISGNRVTFPLPSEPPASPPARVTLTVRGDSLTGEIVRPNGSRIILAGRRAPLLKREGYPVWGETIDLLAAGLSAWRPRSAPNGWRLIEGELVNIPPSSDLMTRQVFTDFMLHAEVNVPPAGNSGIYLRGRHEVQVTDDYGKEPHSRRLGGIYGQVTPRSLPALPAGEWQTFDITLIGRQVTVVLNGITIIEDAEIPGITGGALDSDEGAPGPILLQGDHSAVRYRNIRITPAR